MHSRILFLTLLFAGRIAVGAAIFSLSDSDPNSPAFRRRFMASYGVNEAIEPKLTQADRPLQEAIMPHIRTNPRTAIDLIEKALGTNTNPAFLSILGNLYYQVNDFASSERYLRQALEKFPALRRAWRTLALTFVQRNQFQAAIDPLLKVIELGGGDAQSYGLLAYGYLNQEKYESALAAYRMARMFEPDSTDFRRGQAQCLLQTEQHRAAIALFEELILEYPGENSYWLAQANSFLALGQNERAIGNLQIVADAGQGTWESLTLLGDLYLNNDVPALALQNYRKAFQQSPPREGSDAVRPLTYLVGQGLYSEALDYLTLIRTQIEGKLDLPSRRELRISEARIEMNIGSHEKAFGLLNEFVEKDPLDGEALILLGEYYQSREEFEEAEFQFERATSLEAHAADAFIALGRLNVDRGELRSALVALRKAVQLRSTPNLQSYVEAVERAVNAGS